MDSIVEASARYRVQWTKVDLKYGSQPGRVETVTLQNAAVIIEGLVAEGVTDAEVFEVTDLGERRVWPE